jgi:Mg2+-importing ATPase
MNTHDYAIAAASAVLEVLQVSVAQGLDSNTVTLRQKLFGKNILKKSGNNTLSIFIRQFQSPFFYLLGTTAVTLFFLGELLNAILIGVFVFINIFFGFYQEYHAEKTLADLRAIIAPKTAVRRDGVTSEIHTSELVPGDIIVLEPGDILPADGRIITAQDLLIDESMLTGESGLVRKDAQYYSSDGQSYNSVVYAGTVVVTGTGVVVVIATGQERMIGALAHQATAVKRESLFAQNIKKFTLLMFGLIVCTLVAVVLLHTIFRPSDINLIELLTFAIVLAVSILPEELPMVTTFCLAQGAGRLARQRVMVKRLSAIEDLGGITTLCTDKTGTLTENILTVAEVYGDYDTVLRSSIAVNQQILLERKDAARSFDEALVKAFSGALVPGERLLYLPFDHEHYCAHALVKDDDQVVRAYIRGVPEKVFARCAGLNVLPLQQWMHEQGRQGRRVLAVAEQSAQASLSSNNLVGLGDFTFLGMVAFEDPIKESAVDALEKAMKLGLSVKIITGDTADVAGALAFRIGLITDPADVITEKMIQELPPEQRLAVYQKGSVFARMSPRAKYDLVKALAQHEQVGFLGEGINDAPALKIAHVALAVDNATDIAKDAADFILLDRSLTVIIDGIAQGRRIVANTIKYIQLMLICNISNFYSVAVVSLFVDFLPMTAIQMLLVNILTDLPLVTIAMDEVVLDDIAKPQQYNFSKMLSKALAFGIIGSFFDFAVFRMFYTKPQVLQTMWFMFSIFSELLMFYVMRTKNIFFRGHRPPIILLGLSIFSAFIAIALPFTHIGQSWFGFVIPTSSEYLFFGVLVLAWPFVMELVKIFYYRAQRFFGSYRGYIN